MSADRPVIFVLDDDAAVRDSLTTLLDGLGFEALPFATIREFVANDDPCRSGCLILDP